MADFEIKQNDTSPWLIIEILTPGVSLVAANLYLNMKDATGTLKINRRELFAVKETWDNDGGPQILFPILAGDTDTNGTFEFEVEAQYSDGGIETFPNNRNWTFLVFDDIG